MNDNPFSPSANPQDPSAGRRRSTRIDYVTPIFIFGRDAAGQPFRELTQTAIVNLHGCKLRTAYRVLVGMAIMVECPKSGMSGKAVCVRVWDAPPGLAGREIAVQLIKPQNLWGVATPPPDWEAVAKAMVQGRSAQVPPAPARAATPPASAPPGMTKTPTGSFPAPTPTGSFPAPRLAPASPPPPPIPTVERRLAELEQRSTQLVASVLDILRGQAEELTRVSLEVFRQQMDALIYDVEQRLRSDMRESYEKSAAMLVSLRKDIMDQMTARGAQLSRSAEEALRNRFRELLGSQTRPVPAIPPEPVRAQPAEPVPAKPAEPVTPK
jgi:hypothetical protein